MQRRATLMMSVAVTFPPMRAEKVRARLCERCGGLLSQKKLAMDLGEDELQEADALNAGATKDIKDPRWARAIRILTEGHASDMPRHEVWAVCSSLGTKSEDAIFKWTELFQLDSGKTGEDLLLEADAQKVVAGSFLRVPLMGCFFRRVRCWSVATHTCTWCPRAKV